jgi:hypothetical protein
VVAAGNGVGNRSPKQGRKRWRKTRQIRIGTVVRTWNSTPNW